MSGRFYTIDTLPGKDMAPEECLSLLLMIL